MWWKIYFGITLVEALLNILGLFTAPGIHIFTQIVVILLFLVAVVGLYGYIYRKKIFSHIFWQYFLGIYLLIDIVYLIYSAIPNAPVISFLSFLTIYKPDNYSFIEAIFGVAIDIPLLYALYQLTKEKVYDPQKKKIQKGQNYKWGMLQTALWGYSFVLTFFLFILAFFSNYSGSNAKEHADLYSLTFVAVLFAPLILFWLWVVITYKNYHWNWWRTTLLANALFYSGSIIFGVVSPSSAEASAGFDWISLVQLFILFLSLYVFGREQFK
jgi:hypothetical protein